MRHWILNCVLFTVVTSSSIVNILSSSDEFYHKDIQYKETTTLHEKDLMQLAVDSIGVSVDLSIEKNQWNIQADIFTHPKGYVIGLMEGVESMNIPMKFHEQYQVDGNVVELPNVVETSVRHQHGVKALVACAGSIACRAIQRPTIVGVGNAQDLQKAWEQAKELSQENPRDVVLVSELSNLYALIRLLKEKKDQTTDSIPTTIVFSMSSLETIRRSEPTEKYTQAISIVHTVLASFYDELQDCYGSIAGQLITTKEIFSQPSEEISLAAMISRKLQTDNASNITANVDQLTWEDVESYQVALWTAILLAFLLLIALCALCNMPVGRDSLLYAKFRTDASHRKVH